MNRQHWNGIFVLSDTWRLVLITPPQLLQPECFVSLHCHWLLLRSPSYTCTDHVGSKNLAQSQDHTCPDSQLGTCVSHIKGCAQSHGQQGSEPFGSTWFYFFCCSTLGCGAFLKDSLKHSHSTLTSNFQPSIVLHLLVPGSTPPPCVIQAENSEMAGMSGEQRCYHCCPSEAMVFF